MKKVLILTTSTGQGHNQAASSVEESFEQEGYECIKYDFLARNSKLLNKLIVVGYELLATKLPSLYGFLYNISNTEFFREILKIPFFFNRKKIERVIDNIKPTIIVGTHPFSSIILDNFKKYNSDIPYVLIVTDFKAHAAYISNFVDAYVTGSKYTKNTLISKGIDSRKIFPIGIPINKRFYTEITRAHELKDEYFNLLLMSGSLGLDSISLVLKHLIENKNKLRITVVCGKNDNLKNKLTKYYDNISLIDKKLHILGYTEDISYLMDYCDILISKPGGLTVTESIVKNIPLIIPFAIPGQESENIDFLVNEGYSIYTPSIDAINETVNYYIENRCELNSMKSHLKELSSNYSISKIVNICENLLI